MLTNFIRIAILSSLLLPAFPLEVALSDDGQQTRVYPREGWEPAPGFNFRSCAYYFFWENSSDSIPVHERYYPDQVHIGSDGLSGMYRALAVADLYKLPERTAAQAFELIKQNPGITPAIKMSYEVVQGRGQLGLLVSFARGTGVTNNFINMTPETFMSLMGVYEECDPRCPAINVAQICDAGVQKQLDEAQAALEKAAREKIDLDLRLQGAAAEKAQLLQKQADLEDTLATVNSISRARLEARLYKAETSLARLKKQLARYRR